MSVHRPMVITLSPVTLGIPLVYMYFTFLESVNWHHVVVLPVLIMVFLPNSFLIFRLFKGDRIARILLAAQAILMVFFAVSYIMQFVDQSQDSATAVMGRPPETILDPMNLLRSIGPQTLFLLGILLMFSPSIKGWFTRDREQDAGDA